MRNGINLTPMTSAQFEEALHKYGLTQTEAADRLGVNARTVRRWTQDPTQAGARTISRGQQMRINLMLEERKAELKGQRARKKK